MIREQLDHPILKLPGVGPKTAQKLSGLGLTTLGDLLLTLPRTYENRRELVPLSAAYRSIPPQSPIHVVTPVEILDHVYFGPKGHLKILIRDNTATGALVCFGRNFLAQSLPIGRIFLLAGNFSVRYNEIQSSTFETEPLPPELIPFWEQWISSGPVMDPTHGQTDTPQIPRTRQFGGILPRYPNLGGLGEVKVRNMLVKAVEIYGRNLEDPLPPKIVQKRNLPAYNSALLTLHGGNEEPEISRAHNRMVYQELFVLQLNLAYQAFQRRSVVNQKTGKNRDSQSLGKPDFRILVQNSLPFELTSDQTRVLDELCQEISESPPMARLIQGDVGSGKTVVALLASAHMARLGKQSVLMAPTELLARQHANTAHNLLSPAGLTVAFLSGGLQKKSRTLLLNELAAGNIDLLVGTHAVFTGDVAFHDLGLSIVDEQHRFGVNQRTALVKKGKMVNLLLMSATPIPRTLAMTVYGDLQISTITQKPAGRKDIETHLARMGNENKVYTFVRRELEKGRQAYFVYPLIDQNDKDQSDRDPNDRDQEDYGQPESPSFHSSKTSDEIKTKDSPELKSAEAMYHHLSTLVYPDFPVGLIHGQLKEDEKIRIMGKFVRGEIRVLVSTTVVEVGVDVANATSMVIEHAERFGLAALHQLRGRVGRSELQSYCFLVYAEPLTEVAKQRLKVLKESNDGFLIAEKDLELRGPGDIQGIQQSGFLRFHFADLGRDMDIMNLARKDAFEIMEADPHLKKPEHQWLKWLVEMEKGSTN